MMPMRNFKRSTAPICPPKKSVIAMSFSNSGYTAAATLDPFPDARTMLSTCGREWAVALWMALLIGPGGRFELLLADGAAASDVFAELFVFAGLALPVELAGWTRLRIRGDPETLVAPEATSRGPTIAGAPMADSTTKPATSAPSASWHNPPSEAYLRSAAEESTRRSIEPLECQSA